MNQVIFNNLSNFSHVSFKSDQFFLNFDNQNSQISSLSKTKIVSHLVAKKGVNTLWYIDQSSIYKDLFTNFDNKSFSEDNLEKITLELIQKFKNNLIETKIHEYQRQVTFYQNIINKFQSRTIQSLSQDFTFNSSNWKDKIVSPILNLERDPILKMNSEMFLRFLEIKEALLQIEEGYLIYKNFIKIRSAISKKMHKVLSASKAQAISRNLEKLDSKLRSQKPSDLVNSGILLTAQAVIELSSNEKSIEKLNVK